jgi:hypothetical protein
MRLDPLALSPEVLVKEALTVGLAAVVLFLAVVILAELQRRGLLPSWLMWLDRPL